MSLYRIKSKRHILEVPLYNYVLHDLGGWSTTLPIEDVLSPCEIVETYKSPRVFDGKDFLLFSTRLKEIHEVLTSCKSRKNFYIKQLLAIYERMKVVLTEVDTVTAALPLATTRIKAFQRHKKLTMGIKEFWRDYLDV